MKLLHSKSAAEPILAVSACPCANLFGLVTFSAVTVYRSTTLTTVLTFALAPFQASEHGSTSGTARATTGIHHPAEHYHCCWSPSGRLLTLALPSGVILVFDVEGGSLVRVFTTVATTMNAVAWKGNSQAHIVAAEAPPPLTKASPAPPPLPTATSSFPTTAPRITTSLPADRPVLGVAWCSVPSLASAQLADMAKEVQTRCLPVRLGATASLFDEATQSDGSGTVSGGAIGRPDDFAAAIESSASGGIGMHLQGQQESKVLVSLLTVLGGDGVLRCFVGGLYEVCAAQLALPPAVARCGLSWNDVRVHDLQWRQCAVGPGSDTACRQLKEHSGVGGTRRAASRLAALIAFGNTAIDAVQPATKQHHRLYLTVSSPSTGGGTRTPAATLPSQALWEACLQERLTSLAAPQWLAICYVREYARTAQEAYEKAVQGWYGVLRGRVLVHLGLPAAAALLSSALVAQLTDPDPIALYKYAKQTLVRAALMDDLEALAKMFCAVAYEVTHVCYRCCEMAMAYAVYTMGDTAVSAKAHDKNEDIQQGAKRDEASSPFTDEAAPSLVTLLGELRRCYEAFLRQAANEGECARDLALWVIQQSIQWESGTHFVMLNRAADTNCASSAMAAGTEEDRRDASPSSPNVVGERAGSPSPILQPPPQQPVVIDEVPVSATRQPALYDFLIALGDGSATAASSPCQVDTKGTSPRDQQQKSFHDNDAANAYRRLILHAEQCSVSVDADALTASSLYCEVVTGAGATKGVTSASDSERQLLCCVVEDAVSAADKDSGNSDEGTSQNSAAGEQRGDDDDEDSTPRLYARHETNMDDGSVGNEADDDNDDDDDSNDAVALPRSASQAATLYVLRSHVSTGGLIRTLHLSSGALQLASADGEYVCHGAGGGDDDDDEQAAAVQEPAERGCEVVPLSAADVDVASLEKYLKADFTKDRSVAFTETWYGFLEDDRHVLVCQPTAVLSHTSPEGAKTIFPNAPFFIAVVQDDGDVVIAEERDDDEEDDDEKAGSAARSPAGDASDEAAAASRAALCQIVGMEGVPLRVGMSRARSFCVVVGVTKYVVVSLYDDEY
jgi:hypothetical protein